MTNRRGLLLVSALCATILAAVVAAMAGPFAAPRLEPQTLPDRLTDRALWTLVEDFSEPDGTFHSENLVSNEIRFQTVLPGLLERAVPGRAYLGVGSEQNFTYMAAVRPSIAFIVDIRHGNLDLHLIYKALFELADDRADFVSMLFSRPRPDGLDESSTALDIFMAFEAVAPSRELFDRNLAAIEQHLTTTHDFDLQPGDFDGIRFVYEAWFADGPDITYSLTGRGRGGGFPTYADLMVATDGAGVPRSYLASEASFQWLKALQSRNLVVPIVGNFGGPKAIRAVADYLRAHGTIVSAFYTSNVEQYLIQDGIWDEFCASAATLPFDESSLVIRSARGGFAGFRGGRGFTLGLLPAASQFTDCQ